MSRDRLIEILHELDALGVIVQCDSDEHLAEAIEEVAGDE